MLGLTPFIPGQSDIDQLARMQHKLGSITTDNWPGVEQLPDWHKVSFAHSDGEQLDALLPDAPPAALDLLQQLLCYDPSKRLPAEAALCHSYFAATGEAAVTSPLSDQRAWSGC
jgi:serine/threonine protein kinase